MPALSVPERDISYLNVVVEELKVSDGDILPAVDIRDPRPANVRHVRSNQPKVENLEEQPAARAQASAELLDRIRDGGSRAGGGQGVSQTVDAVESPAQRPVHRGVRCLNELDFLRPRLRKAAAYAEHLRAGIGSHYAITTPGQRTRLPARATTGVDNPAITRGTENVEQNRHLPCDARRPVDRSVIQISLTEKVADVVNIVLCVTHK